MLALEGSGQILPPYNPDSNADSAISTSDLIDFLTLFGYGFMPPPIEIDGVDLLTTLISLTEQVSDLQEQVNDLQDVAMTKDSVIRITWLRDLRHSDLQGASIVDFDMGRVDLSYANLQGAQLMNSSFSDAILHQANLSGANLLNADFDAAILTDADLTGANLEYTYFGFASLQGADLSGTDMSSCYLEYTLMDCLRGCPAVLPDGYTCEEDTQCGEADRFHIIQMD